MRTDPLIGGYVTLALKWNRAVALFSRRLTADDVLSMVQESIEGGRLLGPEVRSLLDVGSGGGIPAIPIKLIRPEIDLCLCEAREKKALFLEEAVRVLAIRGARVVQGRLETLSPTTPFDACSVRGIKPARYAGHLARLVRPEGAMLCFHPRGDDAPPPDLNGGWTRRARQNVGTGRMQASLYVHSG